MGGVGGSVVGGSEQAGLSEWPCWGGFGRSSFPASEQLLSGRQVCGTSTATGLDPNGQKVGAPPHH